MESGSSGTRRPVAVWVLLGGTVFLAGSALVGGLNLVRDPTGGSIDAVIPVGLDHLRGTPFADYLLPGVILVLFLGLLPLGVLSGQWAGRSWAWSWSIVVGLVLLVWIVTEVYLIGYVSPLQPAYGLFALGYLSLCSLPSVRRYFGVE